jgi:MscS family membrane protein
MIFILKHIHFRNKLMANTTANLSILEPFLDKSIITAISGINPILLSIGALILSIIVATLVLAIMKIISSNLAKRTKTEFDDKLLETIQQPVFRLIILGGFALAFVSLGFEASMEKVILNIIQTFVYLVITLFAVNVLNVIVEYGLKDLAKRTDSSLDDQIIPIFHKTMRVVIWAFGVLLILGAWGVDVGPFLAGLGIAGLAISFALQSTLSNIFAGVSLIIDKTFKVGDKVQLDGETGVIHEITLRSTRLRTYDNEIIVIPNDNLAKAKIKNFTQPDLSVRVVVNFGVEYGSDPDKVIKLIENTIKKNIKGIMKDPAPSVIFTEMADSSLNFSARVWVENYGDAYSKKLELNDTIHSELNKAKIGIPFPTQTIHLQREG